MEQKYSTDEETYNYDDLQEVGKRAFDYIDAKVGDEATVYIGEPVSYTASDFMPNYFIEAMGEHAGDWPDYTIQQEKELVTALKATVDSWAEKHDKHPSFYTIKNARPMVIKLLENDEYEEVLSA